MDDIKILRASSNSVVNDISKVIKAISFSNCLDIDSNFLINSLIKGIDVSKLLILNCPKLSRLNYVF